MNLTEEQKKYIVENVPGGSGLIERGNVPALLDAIADIMIDATGDDGEYTSREGRLADRFYWPILHANA